MRMTPLFVLVCAALAWSQVSEPEHNVECVTHLRLPGYTPISRGARMMGTASVSVGVAGDGQPLTIDVQGVPKLLRDTITESLRLSAYSPSCSGKLVRLIFEFRVAGEPAANPKSEVWFHPPNRFSIITAPALPMP